MLPIAFIDQMCALLGDAEAGALCTALAETSSPVSVRLHPLKGRASRVEGRAVDWCVEGRYLPERPAFVLDPHWHGGAYYVQEAASMFVEQAYRCIERDFTPRRVLDLCAAPGGKSTLWRSVLPDGALLVANEPIRQRAQILAENLTKWGHPDVVTTCAYPAEFAPLSGFFDVIAADVPCSGEGMFRKDEGARAEWSPEAVEACSVRQRAILSDIWGCLREGGYLVYSTCTFNREENEDIVAFICRELGAEAVPIPLREEWGVAGDCTGRDLPVCRFFPHRTTGEGLFLALLRKTSPTTPYIYKEKRSGRRSADAPIVAAKSLSGWLNDGMNFRLFRAAPDAIAAVRADLYDDVQRIAQTVRTLTIGTLLAEEKAKKLVPQHALALSVLLADEGFPRAAVDRDTAIAYLRRESIVLPPSVPRGYVLVVFEGTLLGFVNNLGSRANNLYPQEWRIRKQ